VNRLFFLFLAISLGAMEAPAQTRTLRPRPVREYHVAQRPAPEAQRSERQPAASRGPSCQDISVTGQCIRAEGSAAKEWSGFAAVGAFAVPEFDGSEDHQVVPLLAGQANYGNYYAALRGLEASANLIDSPTVNLGPVVRFRFGRDDDIDNATLARLRPVDDALEAGLFASYRLPNVYTPGDGWELRTTFLQDVTGSHEGFLWGLSLGYDIPISRKLRLGSGLSTSYASGDYMATYFSIDADNSARSGLSVYEADAGFNDIGASLRANYAFDERWGIIAIMGVSRFIGDAADSPIVTQEGSEYQIIGGAGISYRF
jgi:outer membrane scaffolding protein for murein synthesis (MipA/OmpV family)